MIKAMSSMHEFWYRASNGTIGGRVRGVPVLLLTTTGRKSGRKRTTPLMYLRDGDDYMIVASFGGHDKHPAWYLNLRSEPQVEVQAGRERFATRAEVLGEEERARVWPRLVEMYADYDAYQKGTERRIPVVRLRRGAETPA
jgi:deazaflavin-dependent oxidoreductase (nitroreductase family)